MREKVWNMRKLYSVRYPKKESACVFMGVDRKPFTGATIGITYPFAGYEIFRPSQTKTNLFEYVLEGKGEVWLDGKWCEVKAGDVYILPQDQEHHYRSDPHAPMKKLWINYVADYMPSFLEAYGIIGGIYRGHRARAYFELAYQYAQEEGHDCYEIADCVHQIVQAVAVDRQAQDGSDAYRIRAALHGAVYEPVTLDMLADTLHISKSNVIRVFKKEYGVTPYEYLLRLKIDAAKLLLCNTEMSVKEIAERVCVSDQHYFSSLFLARVGMRPRDYRKQKKSLS